MKFSRYTYTSVVGTKPHPYINVLVPVFLKPISNNPFAPQTTTGGGGGPSVGPEFRVMELPPDTHFIMDVFAVNAKGRWERDRRTGGSKNNVGLVGLVCWGAIVRHHALYTKCWIWNTWSAFILLIWCNAVIHGPGLTHLRNLEHPLAGRWKTKPAWPRHNLVDIRHQRSWANSKWIWKRAPHLSIRLSSLPNFISQLAKKFMKNKSPWWNSHSLFAANCEALMRSKKISCCRYQGVFEEKLMLATTLHLITVKFF